MKNTNTKYPCDCESMVWFVNHYDRFVFQDGSWLLDWIELDRVGGKINVEHLAVRVSNCIFCGNRLI